MARSNFLREDDESKLARLRTRHVNAQIREMLYSKLVTPENEVLVRARLVVTFTEGWKTAIRAAIRLSEAQRTARTRREGARGV